MVKISLEFSLLETQTTDKFKELVKEHNSVLYLGTDTEADTCASNGFEGISAVFQPKCAIHVPMDLRDFSGPLLVSPARRHFNRLALYKRIERALDTLPKPVAIVCADTMRAGAAYTAYKAVTEQLTTEQIEEFAKLWGLLHTRVPGYMEWIQASVDQYGHTATTAVGRAPSTIIFRQLFEKESSTYTYLLGDLVSKECLLIDSVNTTATRDINLVRELGLHLTCIVDTHVHADHITGAGVLKQAWGEVGVKSAVAEVSGVSSADIQLKDCDAISFGNRKLFALSTPGHTVGCMSFVLDDMSMVFTGDALLIRGCGRTDFQGGSASKLYDSVHGKLLDNQALPDDCVVYPAHDYKGLSCSTILEERTMNPRLTKSKHEFIDIMENLGLPEPKHIAQAVPANMNGGLV